MHARQGLYQTSYTSSPIHLLQSCLFDQLWHILAIAQAGLEVQAKEKLSILLDFQP